MWVAANERALHGALEAPWRFPPECCGSRWVKCLPSHGSSVMSSERYSNKIWNRRGKWDSFRRNSAQCNSKIPLTCICTSPVNWAANSTLWLVTGRLLVPMEDQTFFGIKPPQGRPEHKTGHSAALCCHQIKYTYILVSNYYWNSHWLYTLEMHYWFFLRLISLGWVSWHGSTVQTTTSTAALFISRQSSPASCRPAEGIYTDSVSCLSVGVAEAARSSLPPQAPALLSPFFFSFPLWGSRLSCSSNHQELSLRNSSALCVALQPARSLVTHIFQDFAKQIKRQMLITSICVLY